MPQKKSNSAGPIAVLGLGRFGTRLAKQLARSGAEVIACDRDRDVVEAIASEVAQGVVLNVNDEESLRARGVHKCGTAVIAIGENFEAAVLATVILKQMGVPRVVARARTSSTGEVLRRVGADDVVLAENEAADRWASRLLGPSVMNQIEFHDGYSIIEYKVPNPWVGKGLAELDVRKKFQLHIVAIKRKNDDATSGTRITVPGPTEPLEPDDVLIIMGRDVDVAKLAAI